MSKHSHPLQYLYLIKNIYLIRFCKDDKCDVCHFKNGPFSIHSQREVLKMCYEHHFLKTLFY